MGHEFFEKFDQWIERGQVNTLRSSFGTDDRLADLASACGKAEAEKLLKDGLPDGVSLEKVVEENGLTFQGMAYVAARKDCGAVLSDAELQLLNHRRVVTLSETLHKAKSNDEI